MNIGITANAVQIIVIVTTKVEPNVDFVVVRIYNSDKTQVGQSQDVFEYDEMEEEWDACVSLEGWFVSGLYVVEVDTRGRNKKKSSTSATRPPTAVCTCTTSHGQAQYYTLLKNFFFKSRKSFWPRFTSSPTSSAFLPTDYRIIES